MAPIDTDVAWQTAERRWAQIARNSPDLAPAIALQRRILRALLDAALEIENDAPDVDALSSDAIRSNWLRGLPAFRNASVPVPPRLKSALPALCLAMIDAGAGEAAEHLHRALQDGRINPDSLLRTSFARNDKAIRTSALHMDLSPDLVWLVGELGSAPLAEHLQQRLRTRASLGSGLTDWDRGYCPYCGSWPVLIEVRAGTRVLRCSFCASAWSLTSHRCVYCANTDERFVGAAPAPSDPARRIEFCGACGNYTKVIDVAEPTVFPLLAIEDLATVDLDQAAMDRGYSRPRLFDLDTIEPRTSAGGCT
jgi:FdhE protein